MSDGSEKIMKHTNKKLRLTDDKSKSISECLKDFSDLVDLSVDHAVCITCFRRVEKANSLVAESGRIKSELSESFKRVRGSYTLDLPSPRKPVIEKRMAKSPCIGQENKLFKVTRVRPIQPKPFADLTNTSVVASMFTPPNLFTPPNVCNEIQTSLPTTVKSTPDREPQEREKPTRRKLISVGDEEGNTEVTV